MLRGYGLRCNGLKCPLADKLLKPVGNNSVPLYIDLGWRKGIPDWSAYLLYHDDRSNDQCNGNGKLCNNQYLSQTKPAKPGKFFTL